MVVGDMLGRRTTLVSVEVGCRLDVGPTGTVRGLHPFGALFDPGQQVSKLPCVLGIHFSQLVGQGVSLCDYVLLLVIAVALALSATRVGAQR